MPLSEKDLARVQGIRSTAQGGPVNAPMQAGGSPAVQAKASQNDASFKSQFKNISSDDWSQLFPDESVSKKYFNLMDGKHYNALASMQKNKTQANTYEYWKQTYAKGKEIAQYLNDNRNSFDDKKNKQLNELQKQFFNYHTLAERSSYESWDKKNIDDYSKLKPEDKLAITSTDKKRYRYDDETHSLITVEQYEQNSDDVFRSKNEDFYTNLKTKTNKSLLPERLAFGPGNWIDMYLEKKLGYDPDKDVSQKITPDAGYKTFMSNTSRVKPELKAKVNYVLANWTEQSLNYINENHKSGFSSPVEYKKNRQQAGYLVQDILKEAIASPDQEVKTAALMLNKEINRKGITFDERTSILQDGRFVDRVKKLVTDPAFAYASKENLYKKHKDFFNSSKYLNSNDLKDYAKQKNISVDVAVGQRAARLDKEINMYLNISAEHKTNYDKTKTKFRDELVPKGAPQEFFKKTMFDKNNDLLSYKSWINTFPKDGRQSDLYTPGVQRYEQIIQQLESTYATRANNQDWPQFRERLREKAMNQMTDKDKKDIAVFNSVYYPSGKRHDLGNIEKNKEEHKNQFESFAQQYKDRFDDFVGNEIYYESSMNAGLGAKGAYALEQRSISLNSSSRKATNANNFISFITESTEEAGSAVYVKNGQWNNLDSIEDFQEEGASTKGNKLIQEFFKSKDKHKYDMTYVNTIKDTGQALYMFTDLTTNKKLSVVLPKTMAKGAGERFAQNEYNDDDDYHFDMVGRESLKYYGADAMKYMRDAEIVYNKNTGQKELIAKAHEFADGKFKYVRTETIPLGHNQYLTLDNAVAKAMTLLREYEAQYK
jgi:hypothetical protein